MKFDELQREQKEWLGHNFPKATTQAQFFGIVEEVGELSHAILKREQGIRGDFSEHTQEICDAVGDIVIYLAGFCNKEGIDFY